MIAPAQFTFRAYDDGVVRFRLKNKQAGMIYPPFSKGRGAIAGPGWNVRLICRDAVTPGAVEWRDLGRHFGTLDEAKAWLQDNIATVMADFPLAAVKP